MGQIYQMTFFESKNMSGALTRRRMAMALESIEKPVSWFEAPTLAKSDAKIVPPSYFQKPEIQFPRPHGEIVAEQRSLIALCLLIQLIVIYGIYRFLKNRFSEFF